MAVDPTDHDVTDLAREIPHLTGRRPTTKGKNKRKSPVWPSCSPAAIRRSGRCGRSWRYRPALRAKTLRVTPAMEAGISDHVWSAEEIAWLAD